MVDPLPLVEARIEVAPTCVARPAERAEAAPPKKESKTAASAKNQGPAAVTLTKAAALKGQVLKWCISLANIGEVTPRASSLCKHSIAASAIMI